MPEKHIPRHAFPQADIQRVDDFIDGFDLEPGYPCGHRQPPVYFNPTDDKQHMWKDIHQMYTEVVPENEKIMSYGRYVLEIHVSFM